MARDGGGRTARLARNGVCVCAARAVTALASVVSVPVVYQCLGARRFGVWAGLSGAVAIASLMDMGLGSAQVREVARALESGRPQRARLVLGLGLVWITCFGALLAAAVLADWDALARWLHLGELSGQARGALLLMLLGMVLDGVGMRWQAVLEGSQCYTVLAGVACGAALCGVAASVAVVTRGGGLVPLAAAGAATSALRVLLLAAAARRRAPALTPALCGMRRADVSEVAGYGLRVQMSNAAAAINSESDRLVIAGFFSPVLVGGFDVGNRLVGLLRMPPFSALTALFPASVVEACRGAPERLDHLYFVATRYLSLYAAMTTAVLVVSAGPLVRLWLGHDVPLAASTVAVLTLGCAVNVTSGAAAVVTRSEGRPGRETRYALLATALNLVLTVPLLRWLGPLGVPVSTAVAASVATLYFFAHFHRDSRRPLAPVIRAVGLPAAAAAVAVALTCAADPGFPDGPGRIGAAWAVASRGGTALLITVGVLAALGFFDRSDWTRIRTAADRLRLPRRAARSDRSTTCL